MSKRKLNSKNNPSTFDQAQKTVIKRRHHKILKLVYILTLVLAFATLVLWLLFYSSVFALNLDQIEYSGSSEYINQNQIENIFTPYSNEAILKLDLDQISEQIDDVPGVDQSKITHHWPNGLNVLIIPSTPEGYIVETKTDTNGDTTKTYHIIGSTGSELGTNTKKPKNLWQFKTTAFSNLTLNQGFVEISEAFQDQTLSSYEFIADVKALSAKNSTSYIIELDEDFQIFLGDIKDLDEKFFMADKIFTQYRAQYLEYLELESQDLDLGDLENIDFSKKIIDVSSYKAPVLR